MNLILTEKELKFLKDKFTFSFDNNAMEQTSINTNNILIAFYKMSFGIDVSNKLNNCINIDLKSNMGLLIQLLTEYSNIKYKQKYMTQEYIKKALSEFNLNALTMKPFMDIFDVYEAFLNGDTDNVTIYKLEDFFLATHGIDKYDLKDNCSREYGIISFDKEVNYFKKLANSSRLYKLNNALVEYKKIKSNAQSLDNELITLEGIIKKLAEQFGYTDFVDNFFKTEIEEAINIFDSKCVESEYPNAIILKDYLEEYGKYFEANYALRSAQHALKDNVGTFNYGPCVDGQYRLSSRITHNLDDRNNALVKIHENNHLLELIVH